MISNLKNKENLVTVLMPVYNKGRYIACALDSVLAQNVDFDYKILIIDDCSTDDSVKIIQGYIKRYPNKIEFIQNKENLRLLTTAIKGYELIKTKYWTVLDPDDYWLGCAKMQSAIDYLETHPEFTLYSSNVYLDDGVKRKTIFGKETKDYDFYSSDIAYIGHTSGTFFRNVFKQQEIDEIKQYINTKLETCFRGDSFRNFYHLRKGKAHYEPNIESVYNFFNGIYSSLSVKEKNILNLNFFYTMFVYFKQENSKFFLDVCWFYLNLIFSSNKKQILQLINIYDSIKIFEQCIKKKFYQQSQIHKNFCFYLPAHNICEYTGLFVTISKYLSEQLGFNVYYVDYKDGIASSKLKDSKVEVIYYTELMNVVEQNMPLNIVLPATFVLQMPKFKNKFSKVVFLFEHMGFEDWFDESIEGEKKNLKSFLMLKSLLWIFEVIKKF